MSTDNDGAGSALTTQQELALDTAPTPEATQPREAAEANAAAQARAAAEAIEAVQAREAAHARAAAELLVATQAREAAEAQAAVQELAAAEARETAQLHEAAEARAAADLQQAAQAREAADAQADGQMRVAAETLESLPSHDAATPSPVAPAYLDGFKSFAASAYDSAAQPAPQALAQAKNFMTGAVSNTPKILAAGWNHCAQNAALVKGALAVSAVAGAAGFLLSGPAMAAAVTGAIGASAVASLHHPHAHNAVTGFLESVGDYSGTHLGETAKAVGWMALAPLAKGLYQGAVSYSQFALHAAASSPFQLCEHPHHHRKYVEFVLQHRDDVAYKWPLLTSLLMVGAGNAAGDTLKGAVLGTLVAGGTMVATSLLSPAYAAWAGEDDLSPVSADAGSAAGEPTAHQAQEVPADPHAPVEIVGVAAMESA